MTELLHVIIAILACVIGIPIVLCMILAAGMATAIVIKAIFDL